MTQLTTPNESFENRDRTEEKEKDLRDVEAMCRSTSSLFPLLFYGFIIKSNFVEGYTFSCGSYACGSCGKG